MAASFRMHVDGNDVSVPLPLIVEGDDSGNGLSRRTRSFGAWFCCNHRTGLRVGLFLNTLSLRSFDNYGVGAALLDEACKFRTAVSNAGIKAKPVELEQQLEVALVVVAQGKDGNCQRHGTVFMVADGSAKPGIHHYCAGFLDGKHGIVRTPRRSTLRTSKIRQRSVPGHDVRRTGL